MPASPLRVSFVTTGLSTGGAEMMLLKLLTGFEPARITPSVISLRDLGTIGPRMQALGVPVQAVGLGAGTAPLAALRHLRRSLRQQAPHVVQGWMYHGNLAATLARATRTGRWPVVWSIRQSLYDMAREKPTTAAVIRLGAHLSARSPRAIVYNARVAAAQHEAIGYAGALRVMIPNGFDTARFAPDPDARAATRGALGVSDETLVVGLAARYHPMKNHRLMLETTAALVAQGRDVHLMLVGQGVDVGTPAVEAMIREGGLAGRVTALGERADVAALLAGCDVACLSSSWGEGFPNAIGEAMSCAVPCVVTDVGDSAYLVGDTGRVVAPDDPAALAAAIAALQDAGAESRRALGAAARQRIISLFSLAAVTAQYADLYYEVAAGSAPRRRNDG